MNFPGKLLVAALLGLNAPLLHADDDPFAWPLTDGGLLGPVTLTPVTSKE